jgi:hypothetical protein
MMDQRQRMHWIVGTSTATIGVIVARVVPVLWMPEIRSTLSLIGTIVAFIGLFIIMIGVGRRPMQ